MRMLGDKTSLQSFRWDLVYLIAQLLADKRPGVSALAAALQAAVNKLATERAAFEQVEDQSIVATALLNKSDKRRDDLLVATGGMARSSDRAVYETLFGKLSPSATGKLGLAAESMEISRIVGELAKLPADHPVRITYEAALNDAEVALKAASSQSDSAETALALQRSQIGRLKVELDQRRLETHGQLVALLKDKAEADSFFRATTAAPEDTAPVDKATPPPSPA